MKQPRKPNFLSFYSKDDENIIAGVWRNQSTGKDGCTSVPPPRNEICCHIQEPNYGLTGGMVARHVSSAVFDDLSQQTPRTKYNLIV